MYFVQTKFQKYHAWFYLAAKIVNTNLLILALALINQEMIIQEMIFVKNDYH